MKSFKMKIDEFAKNGIDLIGFAEVDDSHNHLFFLKRKLLFYLEK